MYNSLESRVFDSYLKQSPNQLVDCEYKVVNKNSWLALYNWTRNTYSFFANNPGLLIKRLHDDCDLPWIFGTYSTLENGTKIKTALRKANTAINSLLKFVWETTIVGECNENLLILPEDYIIEKKYITLLTYTGIKVIDNSLIADDYKGMFSALKELIEKTDDITPTWCNENGNCLTEFSGYRRFVRCMYDESYTSWTNIFCNLSGDNVAFNRLIQWLINNDYEQGLWLDSSNGKTFESSGISYKKNITGENISNGNIYLYDHDHIGFKAQYSIIRTPAQSYHLTIQNPRDILSNFESLPSILQKFIVKYHAKCNNCGYCTKRSGGKCKPYTIIAKFENKAFPFCPINHVYSYCWNTLNDEIVDGLIAYLGFIQNSL